ncbi:MAG: undecaprenyl-diphosphate phosphatase [Chloroflexota bacterium]
MLTWGQAVIMAVLQGFAELFPISSLGHSVLLPTLLGWGPVQKHHSFLPFLVLLHLGTAGALFVFYRHEWQRVARAFVSSAVRGKLSRTPDEHLAWMLFFGTLPAGIIGAVLQQPLRELFSSPLVAAIFLAVNGGIMLQGERLRRRQQAGGVAGVAFNASEPEGMRALSDLTWREALMVGGVQAFALIPGISRSGVTICGGLLVNMRHEEAARFAFMLATPLIAAAGVLEVPELFTAGSQILAQSLVGGVLAAITAYFSVRFLERYFRFGRLDPFAYYCIVAGVLAALYITVHGA